MICPHGQLDESVCPECSLLHNVKPLARANDASFMDVKGRHLAGKLMPTEPSNAVPTGTGSEIPASSLRIERTLPATREQILVPGNSGNLHARLRQVLGRGFEVGMLDDGVERRVKQVRSNETSPRAKLE